MKTAVAIRHVAFEDLGILEPMLRSAGFSIEVHEAGCEPLSDRDALSPDLLVILGGPIGVYETATYPWLAEEIAFIGRRLEARRPTLGICLGAQLIAAALGARVYPGPRKEIGWAPVRLTEAGRHSVLAPLDDESASVLHWHGDTFDLPPGASLLASTEHCAHQAFEWGGTTLALQFHLEVDAARFERWLIGHTVEIGATRGTAAATTPTALRAGTRHNAGPLRAVAMSVFDAWLRRCGLS